ncbi:hypothetical protein NM688_g2384 [Phlebia brevispora]|uniref:Uncharacterized protein n=1 Tax=Phlebia brevispora TaxID=194682 RepID=A0ACC1T8V8_9APHY|nr:hypothetical protein NM688_g2384 [Phlebia brevispora]
MSTLPLFPPLDGSLNLLPGLVDWQAEHNPDRPWAIFPTPDSQATTSVSFAEFAKASHRVAHAARPITQRADGRDGEVVAVLLQTDSILYIAVLAGLLRAGLVPFPISPRNSAPAVAHLLEKTDCHHILSQEALSSLVSSVQSELSQKSYKLVVDNLYGLNKIFPTIRSGEATSPLEEGTYPTVTRALYDSALYIHSSGSTGYPKPIRQTHRILLQWCQGSIFMEARARGIRWASMALPTFHTIGVWMQIIAPLTSGQPIALYPPQYPAPPVVPNADNVLEYSKLTGCTGVPAVPSFVEYWAQTPSAVEYLASLDVVTFAGGPLARKAGAALVAAGVKLCSVYGATELGSVSKAFDWEERDGRPAAKTLAEWEYIQFSDLTKPLWDPQNDGTFELKFQTCPTHQPAVENLRDVKGYATADLFEPHPSKKSLWRVAGRTDDVIVLSNGEKHVPIPQEGHIGSSTIIMGAVVFGRGREQAGVLVEPRPTYAIDPDNEEEVVAFRNKIWPIVDQANASAPAFGRVFKEMILVTHPSKPLPRAPKGTIIRKQALRLYQEEIEKLYETVERSTDSQGIAPPDSWTARDIETWLLKHATAVNGDVAPSASVDLFEQGFDSLSATFLRNRLIGALRTAKSSLAQAAAPQISQNFVFEYPTIRQLATTVAALIDPAASGSEGMHKGPIDQIREFIDKYSAGFATRTQTSVLASQRELVVFLTGSTGNIGSHILVSLLSDDRISKVYTFDRPSPKARPVERQAGAFKDRGLPCELLSHKKLVSLAGDLNKPFFGLQEDLFHEIKRTVTHIIHNAWNVNFNHPLTSFESQIAGTRNLADLCLQSAQPIHLLFTSSISVALHWDMSRGPVPETLLEDPAVATGNGYASSKYVVEQFLARAAKHGLQVTSLRVGQVCGSNITGAWNTTDWVPIIVKSSMAIGCMPELDGPVSWIPMDAVANIVLDLIVSEEKPAPLLNVVHPRPVPWNEVYSAVNDALDTRLPFVPYHVWISKLEALSVTATPEDLDHIPGLQLLEFLRAIDEASKLKGKAAVEAGGFPFFRTSELEKHSTTARLLPPIDKSHATMWVSYWKKDGYLA